MSNEAGREQAAGEKVGSVQSPRSHLIYTSDGCRLRNPFAGSGGVGRFFLHKIMTESHLFVIVEKGTTEVVRGMEEDLQTLHRLLPISRTREPEPVAQRTCRQPWKSSAWDKKNQAPTQRKHYCPISWYLKSGINDVPALSALEKLRSHPGASCAPQPCGTRHSVDPHGITKTSWK